MAHICVSKLTTIGSDNSLSPGRRQSIIWTNVGISLIGPWGTHFYEIFIKMQQSSLQKCVCKCRLKKAAILSRPQCVKPYDISQLRCLCFAGDSQNLLDCGLPVLYSVAGCILTPLYPERMPSPAQCEWRIEMTAKKVVCQEMGGVGVAYKCWNVYVQYFPWNMNGDWFIFFMFGSWHWDNHICDCLRHRK